jgi:hypothetical protein
MIHLHIFHLPLPFHGRMYLCYDFRILEWMILNTEFQHNQHFSGHWASISRCCFTLAHRSQLIEAHARLITFTYVVI